MFKYFLFGTDQIDPRSEAAGHHGLSASLTATVYHDRLAVPLGLSLSLIHL